MFNLFLVITQIKHKILKQDLRDIEEQSASGKMPEN